MDGGATLSRGVGGHECLSKGAQAAALLSDMHCAMLQCIVCIVVPMYMALHKMQRALGLGRSVTWTQVSRVTAGLLPHLAVHVQVAELYTGKRGLLFWMGKLTYALIFIVIGGWIVFRFVLPGLGVLELQNGLDSRPNY